MGDREVIDRIKRNGNLWEIASKIAMISLLAYIALALTWLDRSIDRTGRDVASIESDVSSIQSDVSSIQDDVSSIQTDISSIETNTDR